MLRRRGGSLVEVLVALILFAIVMASATGSVLRQQRTTTALVSLGQGTAQLRAASGLLPAQLALLAPTTDDIVSGEASDSALQLRVAVATGIACDSGSVLTLVVDDGDPPASGVASTPRAGDSLWWYPADSSRWIGRRLADAWSDSMSCAGAEAGGAARGERQVLRARTDDGAAVPGLAPVRVTRQVRLAVYRSGDGSWQLGYREWSEASGSFATPQPVAGPFQRTAADHARTGFRYFDAAGAELHPDADAAAGSRVVRVRFTALALPPPSGGATLIHAAPRESADVVLRQLAGIQ